MGGDLDLLGGVGVLLLGDDLLGGVIGGGRDAGAGRAAALAEDTLDGSGGTGGLTLGLGALGAGAEGAAFGTGANPIPLTSQTSSSTAMSFSVISQRARSHNFPA